jgi:hypothetical protein
MTSFFIDLWHDLREKRLWPVAVGLLAAIVAVPAILFKPASDAAPPAATTPRTGAADTLPVVAVEDGPTEGSKLEAFGEKNPFKPMKDLAKQPAASGTSGSGSSASGGSSSGSPSASGGSGSASGGSAPGASGSAGGSGGGTPAGGTPSSTPTTRTTHTTTWFHYTADFSFGTPGSPKKYTDVGSFALLPDDKTPAIVFVGVDSDHKSVMFFISDPTFQADGEGKCNASGPDCKFVTLKLGDSSDEETFTSTDGSVSYDLKLEKINREDLGSGKTPDAPASPKSAKGIAATGAGVATATGTAQSVVPSMFAAGPGVARQQG